MQHIKENMITFMIAAATKRALKIVAAEDDMTISEYLRKMVDNDPRVAARTKAIKGKVGKT